jgi:plasmid segregation protein ParM
MIIGLDIGYGYVKFFGINDDGSKNQLIFKTMVAGYVPKNNFGDPVGVVYVNNTPFVVGYEAEKHLIGDFKVTQDFVGTNEYFAVIAYALKLSKTIPDVLVLGLPPGIYSREKAETLIQQFYRQQFKDYNNLPIPMPKQIKYIPQGAGIYFAHYFEEDRYLGEKNTVVIDVGYRTLDVVLFAKDKKDEKYGYKSEAATSYPLGVKNLYDQVKNAFSKVHGTFISDEIVDKIITEGVFHHFGETYYFDASELVKNFYMEQIVRVIKDYADKIKSLGYNVEKVLLGGGGVVYAKEIKGTTIVRDPQFANARGYAFYGRNTGSSK